MYTLAERQAIYERDKGICQVCLKYCKFDDSHAHHVKPVQEGGAVHDINGGCLTHNQCHTRYYEELHGRKFTIVRAFKSRKAYRSLIYTKDKGKDEEIARRAREIYEKGIRL